MGTVRTRPATLSSAAAAIAVAAALGAAAARADPGLSPPFDAEERAALEDLVRDFLKDNPGVVIEAIRTYQAEEAAREQQAASAAIVTAQDELYRDATSPVVGNPDGDITIVEFFDYRCGYCKRVLADVRKLLESDGRIRYVLKEFPILGPESVTAARASLSVWKVAPDKYMDFHTALLSARGSLTEERILGTASKLGIDADRVSDEMRQPWVEDAIEKTYQLGRRLNINGTPAFVFGDRIVPGAIDLEAMRQLVANQRKG